MRVNVFTGVIDNSLLKSDAIIAIDVLRSSTTILTALANGAERVIPVSTIEEALRIGKEVDAIIGGEVESVKPHFFDFGNSPLEYIPDRVRGRIIVLYTSSGAKLLSFLTLFSKEVLIGALINLSALVDYLIKRDFEEISIITAGKMGQPALEDSYCAGLIAKSLPWDECNRSAEVAMRISEMSIEVIKKARHAVELIELGLGRDVEYSLSLDRVGIVAGLDSTGCIRLL
ncbi:MAG: 2-phosphosulfolactate phosphatase [Nitrososphaerota archaeon]|nr:2-phosphosulfolactate phosphatase [Nitrososphaerota archaeon]